MSSHYGENIHLTIFGQSHSPAIGMTLEGIPAGEEIDQEALAAFMERRAPGRNDWSTPRKEADLPSFLSGLRGHVTCGTPLTAIIPNKDARSGDYETLKRIPRPGHADFTAEVKYGGFQDYAGGGHFSGRLTAPLCIAGGICLQLLAKEGIHVLSRIRSIGGILDEDPLTDSTAQKAFPVVNDAKGEKMRALIAQMRSRGDSVGGVIECIVTGLPAGLGDPMFDGMENRIARIAFGIPAVKGIEFGAGFAAAQMTGSENNDAFYFEEARTAPADTASSRPDGSGSNADPSRRPSPGGSRALSADAGSAPAQDGRGTGSPSENDPALLSRVRTKTNNAGGILGGITNGMPLVFRVAVKPTPSIASHQQSVDLQTGASAELVVPGRHDPCIVPRAVPCVEAAAAIAVYDAFLGRKKELRAPL